MAVRTLLLIAYTISILMDDSVCADIAIAIKLHSIVEKQWR